MTTTRISCPLCGQPVDPREPNVAREIAAWESPQLGEAVDVKPTGAYAHGRCVAVVELANNPLSEQDGVFTGPQDANNVIGSWVNEQVRAGRIDFTGRMAKSSRRSRYGNLTRVWQKRQAERGAG